MFERARDDDAAGCSFFSEAQLVAHAAIREHQGRLSGTRGYLALKTPTSVPSFECGDVCASWKNLALIQESLQTELETSARRCGDLRRRHQNSDDQLRKAERSHSHAHTRKRQDNQSNVSFFYLCPSVFRTSGKCMKFDAASPSHPLQASLKAAANKSSSAKVLLFPGVNQRTHHSQNSNNSFRFQKHSAFGDQQSQNSNNNSLGTSCRHIPTLTHTPLTHTHIHIHTHSHRHAFKTSFVVLAFSSIGLTRLT